MDIGLNNKNTLGELNPAFSDVVFMVESNSNEQMHHWTEWSTQSMSNIKPLSEDFIDTIPELLRSKVKELNDKVKKFEHPRVKWEQVMSGFGMQIGSIGERPITLCFSFAIINGKKVCFYDCTSGIADYVFIEDWLIKHFQLTNDNYNRWNHTNSSNFHNCIHALDRLDKEPRDTVYKK